jgi:hypothetical protein
MLPIESLLGYSPARFAPVFRSRLRLEKSQAKDMTCRLPSLRKSLRFRPTWQRKVDDLIMPSFARSLAITTVAVLLLSACSTDVKRGLCPNASVLANTAQLTGFRDKMEGDPAGIAYEVVMTGVKASCSFDKDEGTADSSVTVTFRATRTPTGLAANYSVPYYVAVTRDSTTIVSKQIYSASFAFRPGESSTTFDADVSTVPIRLDNGKKPYDYGILTGLQLTKAQLDYNTKMGRFAP